MWIEMHARFGCCAFLNVFHLQLSTNHSATKHTATARLSWATHEAQGAPLMHVCKLDHQASLAFLQARQTKRLIPQAGNEALGHCQEHG